MRAACYLRVSTDGQADRGYSLPEQQHILQEYCARRNYTIVEMVRDEGVSGVLTERPGLRRITELADSGAADRLVAVKLDRLGRENRLIQNVLHQARARGMSVEFAEHASGDTPADRLLLNVLGGVAEFEWEQIRKRTMDGRLRKAKDRAVMPNGRAPFGYRCVSKAEAEALPEFRGRDGEYLVIPEQAEVVRSLYQRCASGESLRSLVTWMETNGHRSASGGSFTRSMLHRLLRNTAYVGRPVYHRLDLGKAEVNSPNGLVLRHTSRVRPASEWIELACKPIVTEDLFNAAQQRLDENQHSFRGRRSDKWPLSGVVKCGHCCTPQNTPRGCHGNADVRLKRPSRHYLCSSKSDGPGKFCGASFDAYELEELASLALDRAAEPNRLALLARAEAEAELERAGSPEATIKRCDAELRSLGSEEEKLLELALTGFSAALIQKKVDDIQQRRKDLERELTASRESANRLRDPDAAARHAAQMAEELRAALDEAKQDPARFAQLCRMFLSIFIFSDRAPRIEVQVPTTLWIED